MIIAIDGPAGAGKSSVAQAVASALGFQYINTGAIYRTLALTAREQGVAWDQPQALATLASRLKLQFVMQGDVNNVYASLDDQPATDVTETIRAPEISRGSSQVSAHPAVRDALLEMQRRFGRDSDSLLDGRDIGTVVFPDAELKIFLTASPEERAERRYKQLLDTAPTSGSVPALEMIVAEIKERDDRDINRPVAPLKQADDAIEVDTTTMPFDAVVKRILELAKARQA